MSANNTCLKFPGKCSLFKNLPSELQYYIYEYLELTDEIKEMNIIFDNFKHKILPINFLILINIRYKKYEKKNPRSDPNSRVVSHSKDLFNSVYYFMWNYEYEINYLSINYPSVDYQDHPFDNIFYFDIMQYLVDSNYSLQDKEYDNINYSLQEK